MDIPRGATRRPTGRTGSYSRNAVTSRTGSYSRVRSGSTGRVSSPSRTGRDLGSAAPRISTVKVGALSQNAGQGASRNARVQQSYKTHMAKFVVLFAILAVLAGAVLGVYWSNLFSIKQVTVTGVEHLTSEEMTQLANVPSNTTLLRVDASAIKANIMRDAWVADVDVQRVFPDTLNLVVTERAIGATVVVGVDEGKSTETWAISSDGLWLCRIPEEGSEEAASISPKIFEDAAAVFSITDVAFGVKPEVGTYCSDESIVNALEVVTGLTTELKDQVKTVSATSTENTTLTLDSNIEIAFGAAEDIREKERVCLQIMADHPNAVSYINVRVVNSPTYRAA